MNRLGPGDRLGEYELLAAIGSGGMGRVWVARARGAPGHNRLVAIKTALVEQGNNEEACKVLLDEARIASRVQHSNVCSIHAANRERSIVYLVMDWSDGGTLHELLDASVDHRIDYRVAARILTRVCAGLQAVHDLSSETGEPLGVVHRDVSPQNILISTSGQVRLTDFGVAKARGQIHAPTQTGEVKGKLSYMAPEQVTSKHVDRRADVFGLGCVLYEATTGKRPFNGDDALSTLYQLLEQPLVAPSEIVSEYPERLEAIVLRALQRDPKDRYQSADEFARELEGYLVAERAVLGELEIAGLVREHLSPLIRSRGQAISAAITRLDQRTPSLRPTDLVPSRPPRGERARDERPRRTRWLGVSVAAALALSALLSLSWIEHTHEARAVPYVPLALSVAEAEPPVVDESLTSEELKGTTELRTASSTTSAPKVPLTVEPLEPVEPKVKGKARPSTQVERAPSSPRSTPSGMASPVPVVTPVPSTEPVPAYPHKRPLRELDTENPYAPGPTG